LIWTDGERYEGEFVDGKRTGKGIYIASGGYRYEGYFVNGKRAGKGKLLTAEGKPRALEFQTDKYLLQNLEFKNGKLVAARAVSPEADESASEESPTEAEKQENEE